MKRLSSNRALQLKRALALGGALASGAHAQSAQVPLDGLDAAPQGGSLPTIGATWSVTGRREHRLGHHHARRRHLLALQRRQPGADLDLQQAGRPELHHHRPERRPRGHRAAGRHRCQIPGGNTITFVSLLLSNDRSSDLPADGAVQACQLAGVDTLVLNGTNHAPAGGTQVYRGGLSR